MGMIERVAESVSSTGAVITPANAESVVRSVMDREAPFANDADVQHVIDELIGLGPLERVLRTPGVTDVFVNRPDEIWADVAGRLVRLDVAFSDEAAVMAAVERAITPLGLRIDRSSPVVDARLADGSRLHAAIPPASVLGPVLAIRRFTQAVTSLADLVDGQVATSEQVSELERMVEDRDSFIISGGTGAGKTTLLNLVGGMIDPGERVVVVEDASELALPGHVVRLEAQPPNAEGRGAVTLADLVRSALRLRPDRIVVGEVRGDEALDLINAFNTGHDGSLSTIHANSPEHALWRLETLAMSGERNVSESAIRRQIRGTVRCAVQISRVGGRRRITHVGAI